MTLLGICIGLYPTMRQPASNRIASAAKWWVNSLAILGFLCTIASVPMYLYLPTMWSAFTSFAASMVQAVMTLNLVIVDSGETSQEHLKQD
jgi:formate hydrogenlyase subunit 3/multisubunit Na+/H+ antiporter MnhD subunit